MVEVQWWRSSGGVHVVEAQWWRSSGGGGPVVEVTWWRSRLPTSRFDCQAGCVLRFLVGRLVQTVFFFSFFSSICYLC